MLKHNNTKTQNKQLILNIQKYKSDLQSNREKHCTYDKQAQMFHKIA